MLKFVNLTKIYHTEDEGSLALKNVTITFPEKGFVAVTGQSGSGKTTMLNVLSGFATYEEGDFYVDGVDFLSFDEEDLERYRREDIGFVFQDYHLIENYSVIDNLISALAIVGVNNKTARKKSLELLKKFDLEEFKNNKARSLSSGQKQKLAIARALIKEPKTILCDEPTANLDPKSSIQILEVLKEYSRDHLVIVSTHNYDDAQAFATHFVRIYNGTLTAFEEVKNNEEAGVETLNKKATNPLSLFYLSLKNRLPKLLAKIAFYAAFVATFLFVIALFASNIDDSSAKIFSRETFNNINQNEMLVMRKDRGVINEDDLVSIRSFEHVTGTQLYGLSTEMNYRYRENIDYKNQIIIKRIPDGGPGDGYVEETDTVFLSLRDDLYVKSYQGIITEEDLVSGVLPSKYEDIVVYGDYEIGQEITIYINDPVIQGSAYLQFDFKVVGLLKEPTEELYFSPLFVKSMDYIQFHSDKLFFDLKVNYRSFSKFKGIYENKMSIYNFTAICDPKLKDNEVLLPKHITETTVGFPELENINSIFSRVYGTFDWVNVSLCEEPFSDKITNAYIYVSENLMHQFVDAHTSNVSRVFVDNYPYLDDVIVQLTNNQYDCLSAYRAGSTKYDPAKLEQRANLLLISLALIVLESFAYYFFGYLLIKNEINDDVTLSLLGSSSDSLKKTSLLEIGFANIIALIVGFGLYSILFALPVPFIINVNRYLRFYHYLIVVLIDVVLTLLIWWRYQTSLAKRIKKGRLVS